MSGPLFDPRPAGYPTQQPAPGPRLSPDQARAPAWEGTGSISAAGQVRLTLAEPGRPDGEVAT